MNRLLTSTLALLLLITAGAARASSLVEASIDSRFLVRGEKGYLELVMHTERVRNELDALPVIPEVKDLSIRQEGFGLQPRQGLGRRIEYFLPFVVSSYEVGTYVIPPIEVSIGGQIHRTNPIELRVMDEMKLVWSDATVGGQRIRYSAAFYALDDKPYAGEKQPVELKVYFPSDQRVLDWGIPEFEREGLSVWRFQTQRQRRLRQMVLAGRSYFSVPYPSTISTNRTGTATLGPATLRLQIQMASLRDFNRAYAEEVNLTIPSLTFESRPLPPGAPDGFENAIGNFTLEVKAGETEVREGDPVTLELSVSGSGNLDTLSPPKPLDADGWKLYDAAAIERGEERRELSGAVTFRQFMRPLRVQSAVPPFRLVYFDPIKESYDTLLSESIPLTVLPSTAPSTLSAPPQALPMPLEEMTDILGVVNTGAGLLPASKDLPPWLWQLVPALVALGLLVRIAIREIGPRLEKDPAVIARQRDWREVEKAPDQAGDFYRRVGHFIERWLGDRKDPLIDEVLQKRDQVCFRQESSEARVDRAERNRVLRQIRRIALPLVALCFALSSQPGLAAEDPGQLFNQGRYEEAADGWLASGPYDQLPADTLYNIGDAAYRLGSPGEAALYYRRALQRDPTHPESRQNLRFLERKFGSITIKRPDYQHQLARVSLDTWKNLIWTAAWIVVLGVLVFPATRSGAPVRVVAIAGFVTAPLLALCGVLAWKYYPDDARFAPVRDQVVIVADTVAVRTDAARTAPKVIDAPAGSIARLITRTGDWAYVAFTNDSRGWVPQVDIAPILPETPPSTPKARSAEGAETNA